MPLRRLSSDSTLRGEEIDYKIKPDKLSIKIYHGAKTRKEVYYWKQLRLYDVVITTYDMLSAEVRTRRKNGSSKVNLLSPDAHFHRIILDEAQLIRNPDTDWSQAVIELQADFRLCLTGTPLMNRTAELYSLLQFLRIEPYDNQSIFEEEIGTPLRERLPAEKDKTPKDQKDGTGDPRRSSSSRESALKTVHELLGSIMLRRAKGDRIMGQPIVHVPTRTEVDWPVKFSKGAARNLYGLLEDEEIRDDKVNHLAKTIRLRQMCLHPSLLDCKLRARLRAAAGPEGRVLVSRQNEILQSSDKIDSAIELLETIWREDKSAKIIVFSGFTMFLDIFEKLVGAADFSKTNGFNLRRPGRDDSDSVSDIAYANAEGHMIAPSMDTGSIIFLLGYHPP
ncbi:hypothetical protein PG994_005592 [Apiospora phragmitis]|uniref:Helicase ATP-binding domain-containing protein n=1 Tax=Apiospora phragmitis TaxID=2905665 RepID=A0ABR1VF82_9PEZI